MRILASEHADFRVPAETVFDYVSDVTRWPAWLTCVISVQKAADKPLGTGEELHLCLASGRRRQREDFEVTRYIRNAFLSAESLYSTARRIDFRFERRGAQTRVGASIGYPVFGGLLPAAYQRLIGRGRLRKMLRESLTHLRTILEERAGEIPGTDVSFFESEAGEVRPIATARA